MEGAAGPLTITIVRISDSTLERLAGSPIISDVHANLPALEAVLADIRRAEHRTHLVPGRSRGLRRPAPTSAWRSPPRLQRCASWAITTWLSSTLDIATFSPAAAQAARWTKRELSDEARAFMQGLEPSEESLPIGIFHASPRDPVWEYVLSPMLADA